MPPASTAQCLHACCSNRWPQGEHRSSDKSLQRASARLLAALMHGGSPEERLAMPLLVLLAQQRKLIVLQSQVGRGVQAPLDVPISSERRGGPCHESVSI